MAKSTDAGFSPQRVAMIKDLTERTTRLEGKYKLARKEAREALTEWKGVQAELMSELRQDTGILPFDEEGGDES